MRSYHDPRFINMTLPDDGIVPDIDSFDPFNTANNLIEIYGQSVQTLFPELPPQLPEQSTNLPDNMFLDPTTPPNTVFNFFPAEPSSPEPPPLAEADKLYIRLTPRTKIGELIDVIENSRDFDDFRSRLRCRQKMAVQPKILLGPLILEFHLNYCNKKELRLSELAPILDNNFNSTYSSEKLKPDCETLKLFFYYFLHHCLPFSKKMRKELKDRRLVSLRKIVTPEAILLVNTLGDQNLVANLLGYRYDEFAKYMLRSRGPGRS